MSKRNVDTERPCDEKRTLTEPFSPLDRTDHAHSVEQALRELGGQPHSTKAFLRRIRNIEFGHSAEDDCMTILAWLGNCKFVHKLQQRAYSADSFAQLQVPDLLASFHREGRDLLTLIEVKTTKDWFLRWNRDYASKLARYAELLGLPILLAWRPRRLGMWLLLDATAKHIVRDEKIRVEEALANNLMGVIAGDFLVTPKPGLGLHIEGEIVGEKSPTPEGYAAKMRVIDAFLGTKTERHASLTPGVLWTILCAASEEYTEENKGRISHGFMTPIESPVGNCSAQQILRALLAWRCSDGERIAWRHVRADLNRIMTRDQILQDVTAEIGKTISYVMHLEPKCVPKFCPAAWVTKG